MKPKFIFLISYILLIALLTGCKHETEIEPKTEEFELKINSIYNITQTSATVKVTLSNTEFNKKISGLHVEFGKQEDITMDSTHRVQQLYKKEGTVELTITGLEPKTVYYIRPVADLIHGNNPYIGEVVSIASFNSEVSFTTH